MCVVHCCQHTGTYVADRNRVYTVYTESCWVRGTVSDVIELVRGRDELVNCPAQTAAARFRNTATTD